MSSTRKNNNAINLVLDVNQRQRQIRADLEMYDREDFDLRICMGCHNVATALTCSIRLASIAAPHYDMHAKTLAGSDSAETGRTFLDKRMETLEGTSVSIYTAVH